MNEDSYMMKSANGGNSLITKEDLDNVTCLKSQKEKLDKKLEEKDEYLIRILKSELLREKKIQKVKDKIEEKDKKIKKFLKKKNENIKFGENERYLDHQDILERQKLYEKIFYNYDKKVDIAKKKSTQNSEKSMELKEKIKDYERKNKEYKDKIAKMFDLTEKENEKQNEKKNNSTSKYYVKSNPNSGRGKYSYMDIEDKYEMERFKRENALMSHMNQFQKKINGYLEKNEEKEKKIKKVIEEEKKKREEKRLMNNIHYDEIREKIKDKKKRDENERQKKIENLEKKELKNFAIRQEKLKMNEERRKINQISNEEKQILRAKIKEILNEKKNLDNIGEEQNLINNLMYN